MSTAHSAMVNMFSNPDPHNQGVYHMLMKLYPSFAKKVFDSSQFISKLVMIGYDSSDVLEFPICGKCEALAVPTEPLITKDKRTGKTRVIPQCGCFKCGATSKNPVTFREWIRDEIKHKAPPDLIAQLDDLLDEATDMMALQMMRKAEADLGQFLKERNGKAGQILMPDGTEHQVAKGKVTLNEFSMNDADFKKTLD